MNTTCLYYEIENESISKKEYAWSHPHDRKGDGESEFDAFLECTRNNGFDYQEIDLEVYDNYGKIRVFQYEEWGKPVIFGLAVREAVDE